MISYILFSFGWHPRWQRFLKHILTKKIINKMKKTPFVDKNTGDYNLKYNIQNLTEDFFLPVRGSDSGTNIDNLAGLDYAAIEDIDYLTSALSAEARSVFSKVKSGSSRPKCP